MKITITLLSLIIFYVSACNLYKSDKELRKTMDEADIVEIPDKKVIDTTQKTIFNEYQIGSCENLVLEVTSERYGMISPQGKVLDIRILRNRKIEYDYYDNLNDTVRKELTISESQFNNLLKVLDSEEMINSKSRYVADNICIDTVVNKKITFCPMSTGQKKEILVNECGSPNFDEREKLPFKIIDIIEEVYKIRKAHILSQQNIE